METSLATAAAKRNHRCIYNIIKQQPTEDVWQKLYYLENPPTFENHRFERFPSRHGGSIDNLERKKSRYRYYSDGRVMADLGIRGYAIEQQNKVIIAGGVFFRLLCGDKSYMVQQTVRQQAWELALACRRTFLQQASLEKKLCRIVANSSDDEEKDCK